MKISPEGSILPFQIALSNEELLKDPRDELLEPCARDHAGEVVVILASFITIWLDVSVFFYLAPQTYPRSEGAQNPNAELESACQSFCPNVCYMLDNFRRQAM